MGLSQIMRSISNPELYGDSTLSLKISSLPLAALPISREGPSSSWLEDESLWYKISVWHRRKVWVPGSRWVKQVIIPLFLIKNFSRSSSTWFQHRSHGPSLSVRKLAFGTLKPLLKPWFSISVSASCLLMPIFYWTAFSSLPSHLPFFPSKSFNMCSVSCLLTT